jgi:hypothetical protein
MVFLSALRQPGADAARQGVKLLILSYFSPQIGKTTTFYGLILQHKKA